MAEVHLFTALTTLTDTFRIPIQYLGDAESPAARAIPAALLLEWLQANLEGVGAAAVTVATGGTVVVPAGNLLTVLAIEANATARTVKIGTSSGADDILELTSIPSNSDFSLTLNRYTSTSLTLHFTLTGATASVLTFLVPKI